MTRTTFFSDTQTDWTSYIGNATDPNDWLSQRLRNAQRDWSRLRDASDRLWDGLEQRYAAYVQHMDMANRVRDERSQRANNFQTIRDTFKEQIRNARQEVLSEMDQERGMLTNSYHAEIAGLRFYNLVDWGRWVKAKIKHIGRVGAHNVGRIFNPAVLRTIRKKNMYRKHFRQQGSDYRDSDKILRDVQKTHRRAAFLGSPFPARPGSGNNNGPTNGPTPGP